MATTFGQLIDRVRYSLRSYTGQHEVSTHLTADATEGAVDLSVADGNAVATGLVEIEDELVWVDSSAGGVLTVPPYGRGYQGSTAAAHLSGKQVITDPFFPRKHIADAIVDTQRALYPTLFQPKAKEFTFTAGQSTYDLDSDVDRVLSVSWQLPGSSEFWTPVRRWRTDTFANTTEFASGSNITVFDPIGPDRTVRAVYAAPFTELTVASDTIGAAGHQEAHVDLLVFGACWRLLQFLEVSRLNLNSVENAERAKFAASGSASALTRQVLALYERRLEEERKRLLQLYPITIRYTR